MAKGKKRFSVTAGLLSLGDALRFSASAGEGVYREKRERARLIPAERFLGMKQAVAKMREQSLLLSFVSAFGRGLLFTRCRSFATLLFTCGLLQTVSYFMGGYFPALSGDQEHLVFGLILIVLALACAFERQSVGGLLKKSILFRYVLHPLLGLEEWEVPESVPREHFWSMLLFGTALGLLAVLLSPVFLLGLCLLLLILILTLYKPESGLVLATLLFSFLPGWAGMTLLIFVHLSLLMKLAVGKRSLVLSPADLPVWLFLAVLVLHGGAGSLGWALLISSYFLGLHLLRTVEWIRRVSAAMAIAVGVGSLAVTVERLLGRFVPDSLRLFPLLTNLFATLTGQCSAAVTAMLLPFLLCLMAAGQRGITRFSYLITGIVALAPLGLSHDPGLWLGAAAGVVLVVLLSWRWGLFVSLCTALGGYTAWMLLPYGLKERAKTFFGLRREFLLQRAQQLKGDWERFQNSMPWGQGGAMGGEGSVYLRLGIYGGWIALLCLAAAVIWFFVRCMRFSADSSAGGIHSLVLGAMAAILTFLICGVTADMGGREEFFFLFLFLSFPKAARIACERKEYRQPY